MYTTELLKDYLVESWSLKHLIEEKPSFLVDLDVSELDQEECDIDEAIERAIDIHKEDNLIDDDEVEERFESMLNESNNMIKIEGGEYLASDVLKDIDWSRYKLAKLNYIERMIQIGEWVKIDGEIYYNEHPTISLHMNKQYTTQD